MIDDDLDQVDKLYLLLLHANGGEAVPGDLWIQKELFLMAKNMPKLEAALEFEPYLRGPFSETVEGIHDKLEVYGLVQRTRGGVRLTEKGDHLVENFYEEVPDDIHAMVQDIKDFANDLSKEELLVYVYYSYPDMTKNSMEKAGLEQKRERVARHLYDRGKVSLEKASELAGVPLSEFQGAMRA
jgi:predicted HTH domain antitoxin